MSAKTVMHDPERYVRLAAPRPYEEADGAVKAFIADVNVLRDKHGIADVNIVAAAVAINPNGASLPVGSACSHAHFGNQANALPMAALAFRLAREDRRREEEELVALREGE